ncbi:MAG: CDP-alcohol phosphatidyltransferase family protein [Methanothrix sp.]|uniref:CDP-alcohol phosphatidyltransferase n=1 Tax=Methanothrix harundinacea TaxID=301375 RepID=A0A117MCZ5_9EURY|nr:MAG: CDP-alcohol phosphatidyltransferase [Methanothrix harundinacea]MDD2638059.1 CDP-alcohol phosphatidyltransferase family protein [Methanothrix sp.]MDI9398745.1 CDP-alcohol phosphatidyltransferase family protein [Euryarchaeota archaeon]KUK97239.1 MAG: CDP-alcohol phosphatidyltransferase [Methanothrix harundinacea]MCP1391731.1 CDP-alcohol phosphatidyltransferase family protein [Methanothrix harundinacea]
MTLDDLRSKSLAVTEPLAALAEGAGASPNLISLLSMIFALAAGAFYYFSAGDATLLGLAALMVLLNSAFDAVDGALARRTGRAEPKGDFLDHVIDRYADMAILVGIILAGYVSEAWGIFAVMGVLLTSYLGTQAQALQLGRLYGGIMGRADRLILILAATVANALYPGELGGLSILGWAVILITVASHVTALQRILLIWRRL